MLGSEDQLKFFDESGFGEMSGWYLCDGLNGAPDLRARVEYGRNLDERIETHGANNYIRLIVDHMPSDNHKGFILLIYFEYNDYQ
jgi:hypothetical protein